MFIILLLIELTVVAIGAAVHRYLAKHHARDRENVPDSQRLTFWTATATLSIVFFIVMTVLFNFIYAQGFMFIVGNSSTLMMILNVLMVGFGLVVFVAAFDLISPNSGFRSWVAAAREKQRAHQEIPQTHRENERSFKKEDREKEFELFMRTICYILFLLIIMFTLVAVVFASAEEEGTSLLASSEIIQTMLAACTFALMPISIRQVIYYLRNMKRISKLGDDEETRRLNVKNFINKENTKL